MAAEFLWLGRRRRGERHDREECDCRREAHRPHRVWKVVDRVAAAWLAQSMPPEESTRKNAHDPSEGAQDNLPHAYRKITPEWLRLRCRATHGLGVA